MSNAKPEKKKKKDSPVTLTFTGNNPGTDGKIQQPVESRQYSDTSNLVWVTNRKGGLSVWDIGTQASDPQAKQPTFVGGWNLEEGTVCEGQDRLGDLLLVANVGLGLFVLDISDVNHIKTVSYHNVNAPDGNGPLHIKWYAPTFSNKRFALLSMGFSPSGPSKGSYLCAVDVTDPSNPTDAGSVKTGADGIEGVFVVGDYAYVGGFFSTKIVAISLAGLATCQGMSVHKSASNPSWVQMVSGGYLASSESSPDYFFSSLWTNPGGLASFKRSAAAGGDIVFGGMFVNEHARYANRVHVAPNGLVLMPCQNGKGVRFDKNDEILPFDKNGGIVLADVRDPTNPELVASHSLDPMRQRQSQCYCAALHPSGRFVYGFGFEDNTMRVFSVTGGWW